jgi:CMP-N,N'-diacetyllegionaminic acid synthase
VPARAGSSRVPDKNVRILAGHPLIAYTIAAARESGLFEAVVVSTDSAEIAEIGRHYGAEAPELRPPEMATASSPDIEWIRHMIGVLAREGREFELFSILRPTSPFRTSETIRRAWDRLTAHGQAADSIRAVELCRQHPGKMWTLDGDFMTPLLDQPAGVPLHSSQYQALPKVYIQNSSLEIAWTRVLEELGEIAGRRVLAFLTDEAEGFSIDYPDDFLVAEAKVDSGEWRLPEVRQPAAAPGGSG